MAALGRGATVVSNLFKTFIKRQSLEERRLVSVMATSFLPACMVLVHSLGNRAIAVPATTIVVSRNTGDGLVRLIAYYRVSTARQSDSGLSLDAQRAKVQQLAAERGAEVVAEFVEVESGRKADRPQLAAALAEARKLKAVIAVAKLDRIARDAEAAAAPDARGHRQWHGRIPVLRSARRGRHHRRWPNGPHSHGQRCRIRGSPD